MFKGIPEQIFKSCASENIQRTKRTRETFNPALYNILKTDQCNLLAMFCVTTSFRVW